MEIVFEDSIMFQLSLNILMPPFTVIPKINLLAISSLLCLMKCMIKSLFLTFEYEIAFICWTPFGSYCHHRFVTLVSCFYIYSPDLNQTKFSSNSSYVAFLTRAKFYVKGHQPLLVVAKCLASASILCSCIYFNISLYMSDSTFCLPFSHQLV